jgi:hypothetical protein
MPVTSPRNIKAFRRSQRYRVEIRRVWIDLVQRRPFEPVTAAAIARHLKFTLSASAIRWHMRAIRTAALVADADRLAL